MRRLLLGLAVLVTTASAADAAAPIKLEVDGRDAPRKLFRATVTIPVSPGAVTLRYPKWIPGEHGPSGPITDLAGLEVTAGGKRVAWTRDASDMFAFHVDAPAGTKALVVSLEFLSPTVSEGFSGGAGATPELAMINWNQLVLYPAGSGADAITVAASLRMPAGWKHGSALAATRTAGDTVTFVPVSLTTLVDSPVLMGAHTRTIELSKTPLVRMFLATDDPAALEVSEDVIKAHQALMAEARALFGARHYDAYTFLVTLSDTTAQFGLEHHQSSDDRMPERALTDDDTRRLWAELLSHELVHSWNGKYRRPAGLITGGFDQPVDSNMLWIYEGLTEYLGWVLATRAGLITVADARERLATVAARMDSQAGRRWRPLTDTAGAAQLLYGAADAWRARRRSVDFYPEGLLMWLEIDGIIRRESKGARSIDDFCRAFFGGKDSGAMVSPYTLDELVAALESVQHYDWKKHLSARVTGTDLHAPLGGVTLSGWTLAYVPDVPDLMKTREDDNEQTSVWYSIGVDLEESGEIIDVLPGSPADAAGLVPGGILVAVDGRAWTAERLRERIAGTRRTKKLALLVRTGDFFRTSSLAYAGGERYPQLARDEKIADSLAQILAAHR